MCTMLKSFLLILISLSSIAQEKDQFNTDNGPMTIQPILHGTLVIQWNNEVIYVDPYGGKEAFEGVADPTMIMITDIHGDHMSLNTLATINTENASIIAPLAVADKLPEEYRSNLTIIGNGESTKVKEIPIKALPMYNLPETDDSRHPKGRGNGYLLDLGGKRVYISGDTEDIPEMRELDNIAVAFICMNLPYTMSIEQAADAVLAFKPSIVYPYHYRGKDGLSDIQQFKYLVDDGNQLIEVRLRDWYPEK